MKFTGIPNKGRDVKEYPLNDGETFIEGALVLLDADEEVAECGADPAAVLGLSLGDAGNLPRDEHALVALAKSDSTFLMPGDDDPTEDDINQEYGAAVDGDGVWYVDGTDTTNIVFYVEDVDTDRNLYEVKIVEAARQISG